MTTALQAKQLRQQCLLQAMQPATANAKGCTSSTPWLMSCHHIFCSMSDLDNKADHHLCKTSYAAVSIYLGAVTPCVICQVGKTASQIASRFSKVTLYKPDLLAAEV